MKRWGLEEPQRFKKHEKKYSTFTHHYTAMEACYTLRAAGDLHMPTPKGLVNSNECLSFLTLPGEELILAKREHWFILLAPLILTVFLGVLFTLLTVVGLVAYFPSISLIVSSCLLIFLGVSSLIIKQIADWHYHMYIITTRKLLEVNCAPLFSHAVNDVLIDQVIISEVDTNIKSFMHELFDMGDIVIVFDGPSRQGNFVISHIQEPNEVGGLLSNAFELLPRNISGWSQQDKRRDNYKLPNNMPETLSHKQLEQ